MGLGCAGRGREWWRWDMAFAMGGAVVVGGECGTAATGRLRREGRCHGIRLCGPGRG
jgi:hypothetical protein